MSFELFVERFENGATVAMPRGAFEVFRPYVAWTETEHDLWHICTPDEGEGDIYAKVTADAVDGFTISDFTDGGLTLDLVVEFARRAGGVIFSSAGPTLLLNEAQRADLPQEDRDEAVVVHNASGVIEALRAGWADG